MKKNTRSDSEEVMSMAEFLKLGFRKWVECHWTLASNDDEAREWFASRGLHGKMYRVPYGWLMPIEEESNEQ